MEYQLGCGKHSMALGGIAEQDTKLDKTQGPECSYGGEALEHFTLG